MRKDFGRRLRQIGGFEVSEKCKDNRTAYMGDYTSQSPLRFSVRRLVDKRPDRLSGERARLTTYIALTAAL